MGLIFLSACKSTTDKKVNGQTEPKMKIIKEKFGTTPDGQEVDLYILTNINGIVAKITNFGGILTSLTVPDKNGDFEDIVLGFDDFRDYLGDHPHFGTIIGRYGNRIAAGKFSLDGVEYSLARNNGENHLHGGLVGFDKVVWVAESFENVDGLGVKFNYLSKDLEEGYPGNLTVEVTYFLSNNNEFKIDYTAETDKACPVNLTHHSYFNLAAGKSNILDHEMMINADRYVVVDEGLIPTGELRELKGTVMDFTVPHTIGSRIDQVEGGYDHTYVLNKSEEGMTFAARVHEKQGGRIMEVYTTEPGVQFYTGNFLDGSLTGKNGFVYEKHFGFCLETQHFPDSPNQPDFPSTILRPGEKYRHSTVYKFLVEQ
ncbi:MAG: galactose mutarotase [Bacteroidales bacterium]|nr:MAG: galactose mutarotase [Bacteroidales bacterium]